MTTDLVLAVFAVTYLGMALGRLPGLKLDRTGIALVALAVLFAGGGLDIAALGRAVDGATLLLLFALMILSAQFGAAGFYAWCAGLVIRSRASPAVLLAATVGVGAGLSAVLANDVVVFALAPLLCEGMRGRGLDPRPYLVALAGASNAGSAATLIGNPQNILIGQTGRLGFWDFVGVCGVPALAALVCVYFAVRIVWRRELRLAPRPPADAAPATLDRWQTAKALFATLLMVALFTTPLPREVGALAVAAALLASRKLASRTLVAGVDFHLLLLFVCLFGVTAAFVRTGVAADGLAWLAAHGLAPASIAFLAPLALALSNTIGNVPAVVLLLGIRPDLPSGALYGLALFSTLAGNLLIVGSIANLITAERAQASGVRLGFWDFARAGVPMTLAGLAFAALWLGLTEALSWG